MSRLTAPSRSCLSRYPRAMGSDGKTLPIIDIAPLLEKCDDPKMAEDEGVLKVVRQLDEACKESGFFYVKGHGIPESLIKEAREAAQKFFDLPFEEKQKIKMTSSGYRGYQIIGGSLTYGTRDYHEAINCYTEIRPGEFGSMAAPMEGPNLWPDTPSNLKSLMDQYTNTFNELGRKIMRGLALALGGPADAFEGDIAGNFWMLRLLGYPGFSESEIAKVPQVECGDVGRGAPIDDGLGAHTDDGLVTFIDQAEDINALQMKTPSGEWVTAPPVPGALVCVLGEMLKILSNGIYEATAHQVYNSSPKYRVAIGFFYETNFSTPIQPFDFCLQKTGGVAKYKEAIYGDLLVTYLVNNMILIE